MVWLDSEILQSFILDNRKQRINFNSVINVSFWIPGSFQKVCFLVLQTTFEKLFITFAVQKMLQRGFVKSS